MTITLCGLTLEVKYTYHKAHRGMRDSFGVPMEPDEPAEVEIEAVMLGKEDVTELCEPWMADIEAKVLEGME